MTEWTLLDCAGGGALLKRGNGPINHPQSFLQIFPIEDAHLIVAAPDMLAALKLVMDEYRDGYGLSCIGDVRAAIAKAEGREVETLG